MLSKWRTKLIVTVVEEKKGQVMKKGAKKAVKSSKKRSMSRKKSFATYIYKVMRQVSLDTSTSSKAMSIMKLFANDIFECIVGECSFLTYSNKDNTISSRT
eukprot:g24661.t1